MDNYIIELFGGQKVEITHEEYRSIMGATGLVVLDRIRQAINVSAIKRIVPKKVAEIDDMEDRKKTQRLGILHDGTEVIRSFGVWYYLNGEYDARGNPCTIVPFEFYPEAAYDIVPTSQEYSIHYSIIKSEEKTPELQSHSKI